MITNTWRYPGYWHLATVIEPLVDVRTGETTMVTGWRAYWVPTWRALWWIDG